VCLKPYEWQVRPSDMPRASWSSLVNSANDANDIQIEVDSDINHQSSN